MTHRFNCKGKMQVDSHILSRKGISNMVGSIYRDKHGCTVNTSNTNKLKLSEYCSTTNLTHL